MYHRRAFTFFLRLRQATYLVYKRLTENQSLHVPTEVLKARESICKLDKMFITVVGGGNSTAIFAALAKIAGHEVAILTRQPEKWSKTVGFVNEDPTYCGGKEKLEATVDLITSDPAECIPQSKMIFIAGLPIHFNKQMLTSLSPHIKKDNEVFIGTVWYVGITAKVHVFQQLFLAHTEVSTGSRLTY